MKSQNFDGKKIRNFEIHLKVFFILGKTKKFLSSKSPNFSTKTQNLEIYRIQFLENNLETSEFDFFLNLEFFYF